MRAPLYPHSIIAPHEIIVDAHAGAVMQEAQRAAVIEALTYGVPVRFCFNGSWWLFDPAKILSFAVEQGAGAKPATDYHR